MEMSSEKLNRIIKNYVNTYIMKREDIEEDEKEFMAKSMSESFYKDIYNELLSGEKEKLKKQIINEYKKEKSREKLKKLKWLVLETLLVGIVVGLFVNQITDFISISKGIQINSNLTFRWVLGLGLLLIVSCIFIYAREFEVLVDKEEDK